LEIENWVAQIREDFPALKNLRRGRITVYLNSACTTMVPRPVRGSISKDYQQFPGCAGARSRHWFPPEVNNSIEINPDVNITTYADVTEPGKGDNSIFIYLMQFGNMRGCP
jgi:hypothetical protein